MPAALPMALRAPITTREEGEQWIRTLAGHDLSFHFEDDPATIINIDSGALTFVPEDHELIRERVRELYALDWAEHDCPIGFLLLVEESR